MNNITQIRTASVKGANIAALGTSSTILQLDKTHLPKVIKLVKEAARKISEKSVYNDDA